MERLSNLQVATQQVSEELGFEPRHSEFLSTCMHVCVLSCFGCVQLFVTLWPVAHQAPLP